MYMSSSQEEKEKEKKKKKHYEYMHHMYEDYLATSYRLVVLDYRVGLNFYLFTISALFASQWY